VDAPTGPIEGKTTCAINSDTVVALRDDTGEIPDAANRAFYRWQPNCLSQTETEVFILYLFFQVGDGGLDYVRRGSVAALLVPATANEAGGEFWLRAAEAEEATVFADVRAASVAHSVLKQLDEIGVADADNALAPAQVPNALGWHDLNGALQV